MSLSGYALGEQIGDGGMAAVYKGTQLSLQRPVAIKVLKRKLADHDEIRERFKRESLIIARLNHPNIIHVIDQGFTKDGRPYFIMDYVKSITLNTALAKGSMSFSRALDIFSQIAKALSYAHKNKVVHCDIKPENILVDFEGYVRVLDFGIAQIYEDAEADSPRGAGYVMGSENYMAPEQHASITHATEQSDIYSLGVIMYLYFANQLPKGTPAPPSTFNKKVSRTLDTLIMQCLAHNPNQRPASADEVNSRLLKLLQGEHLNAQQRASASESVKKSFKLLDVIKEDKHSGCYLFEEQDSDALYVIKKKAITNPGFETATKLSTQTNDNIARIYGTSKNERFFIVVMEYCHGGSLADRLVQAYDVDNFCLIAGQIVNGLRAAKKTGLQHGNLRPTNILFDDENRVKVADFGLREHYQPSEENWYSIPGEEVSERTDVFALGVIFYQMVTGDIPKWKGEKLVKNASFRKLPAALQKLIRLMIISEPEQRIGTLATVETFLNRLQDDAQTTVRPLKLGSKGTQRDLAPSQPSKPTVKSRVLPKRPIPRWRLAALLAIFIALLGAQVYLISTDQLTSLIEALLS
jgi:serine/threonine protein kinase